MLASHLYYYISFLLFGVLCYIIMIETNHSVFFKLGHYYINNILYLHYILRNGIVFLFD